MRKSFSERVERGRDTKFSAVPSGRGDPFGFFVLRMNGARDELRIMVSAGIPEIPWEHVSVSVRSRCPTWEEMSWVKDLFFDEHEVVVQYHPSKSDYVNAHPFCLHLWRPKTDMLPSPPWMAVGPRTIADLQKIEAFKKELLER